MGDVYVQVAEDEEEEPFELPGEPDGTLLLSTLISQHPTACGLKFRNPDTGIMRGVRLIDGRFHPPEAGWGTSTYYCVFPKAPKKKDTEQVVEKKVIVEKTVVKSEPSSFNNKCMDLIVLSLPFNLSEEDLRKYFEAFGELDMVELKMNPTTGKSKGFGFIRFVNYEDQLQVLSKRHKIEQRWCEVKIPESKAPESKRKIFVGGITQDITFFDLKEYFSQFGGVLDVFIPTPFRNFAFVTFVDADVAQSLCGEDHQVKGVRVRICKPSFPKGPSGNNGGRNGGRSSQFGMGNRRSSDGMAVILGKIHHRLHHSTTPGLPNLFVS